MEDILVPLQPEELECGHPHMEYRVVVEKDIEKLCRKLEQAKGQWRYPRNWEYVLVLNRRNADANGETTDGAG